MTGSEHEPGLRALHEAMAKRVESGELPGIVYLVAHGEDVLCETIGTTTLDGAQPMGRDTVFRIASLTKPIVAAATMILVEDGLLALDEPVDRLLPELANRRVLRAPDGPLDDTVPARRPITVDDLLTFRMGHGMITEPSFQPPYPVITTAAELELVLDVPDPRTTLEPDEWLRRFATLPLMHQPGQRWQYNTAALVLGVLLARAAGQSLPDLLRERVFEPLGMSATGFQLPAAHTGELPGYYAPDPATGRPVAQTLSPTAEWRTPPPFPSAASGLLSTVDDYLAFAAMLRAGGTHNGDRLLSPDSVRLITGNHLTPEQIAAGGPLLGGSGWGYGMSVSTEPDDTSEPGRYGWAGGTGTVWFTDPHRDLIAIALTQSVGFLTGGVIAEFSTLAARS